MNCLNVIKMSDIFVPKSFERSQPKEQKLNKVRAYVDKHGELDKPIVLDGNMLTDNYVRYLVAMEYGFDEVPCITTQEYREQHSKPDEPTTYIIGKFKNCEKEYTWKIVNGLSVEVGDRVLVKSKCKNGKNGTKAVTVVRVFTTSSPRMLRHKPVVKKLKAAKAHGKPT